MNRTLLLVAGFIIALSLVWVLHEQTLNRYEIVDIHSASKCCDDELAVIVFDKHTGLVKATFVRNPAPASSSR